MYEKPKYSKLEESLETELLLHGFKKNKEVDPIKRALRFLFLSNFTFMGKMDTLRYGMVDQKAMFFNMVNRTSEMLYNVQFNNSDFRKFLKDISFTNKDFGRPSTQREDSFIYNDPPYLGTVDTYSDSDTWTEQDVIDLWDANEKTGCKYAISEFDHPFIIDQAKQRGLNVIEIGERQNLKNRRTEILVTNYKNSQLKLF